MSAPDDTTDAQLKVNPRTQEVYAAAPIGTLGKPTKRTVSIIWMTVVFANAGVMVAAALCLCVGMFFGKRDTLVEAVLLLNLVTTPSAFLAGLVARDPGQHQ